MTPPSHMTLSDTQNMLLFAEPAAVQNPTAVHSASDDSLRVRHLSH